MTMPTEVIPNLIKCVEAFPFDKPHVVSVAEKMLLLDALAELLAVREAHPVAVIRHVVIGEGKTGCHATLFNPLPAGTELFTAPPAPVLMDERHPVGGDKWGWDGEYNRGWNAYRAAMLNHVGGSDEKVQPIFFIEIEGDDWINAGRIPGSTFDFNNLPDGINHLYAAPPAPAVSADVAAALDWIDDFIARCNGDDRGACNSVNVLRAAMLQPVSQGYTLLAGENCWSCGKYFTYAQHSECDGYCPHCNAPVDLEDEEDQPLPSVPDEMTGAIAMTQYGIKPSNYKQWVKGWNACRAARIRLSGSSEQKGKRLRIAEGKFAAYFPQERPLSGARVIAWDESGNLLGVGFGLETRQTGIAIIINGKKYDSNHVIHWCNSPVVPDGCDTMPNGQPAAHVSLESFSSDGTSDIMTKNLPIGTALFTAPPVPSVTRDLLDAMTEVIRISDRDHEAWSRAKNAIAICRAAIPATAPDEIEIFVDQVCGNLPTGHQQ
ncbi:hypothetical protein ABQ345_09335 [Serratia fonticola]|uniref:hypothetical protein n=1 Tax=Serratia fonticola TaxID=47917 RepID=UPI003AAA6DD3